MNLHGITAIEWAASWHKPTKWHVRTAMTQIGLGMRPVWSVFTVRMKKAWVLSYPLSAQRRLIAGRTATFVLSWGGSNQYPQDGFNGIKCDIKTGREHILHINWMSEEMYCYWKRNNLCAIKSSKKHEAVARHWKDPSLKHGRKWILLCPTHKNKSLVQLQQLANSDASISTLS